MSIIVRDPERSKDENVKENVTETVGRVSGMYSVVR